MSSRGLLYTLLTVVAVSAALLSFDALRGLAAVCGFGPWMAPLLPVVVDAGAAAGSLVWLGERAPDRARRFARVLALVLLGSSVAANALSHGLAAYGARPAWWVVVLVSGVAPAVLGATVHLAVLVGRAAPAQRRRLDSESLSETSAKTEPVSEIDSVDPAPHVALHVAPDPTPLGGDVVEQLLAAGAGRRKLMQAGLSESQARKLLDERKNGTSG